MTQTSWQQSSIRVRRLKTGEIELCDLYAKVDGLGYKVVKRAVPNEQKEEKQ